MNTLELIPYKLAENAAFLWVLYTRGQCRPDYNDDDLTTLKARINAQLDGLFAYGDEAWQACEDSLNFEAPGEVFTAAVVALRNSEDPAIEQQRVKRVVTTACKSAESFEALVSAFSWLPFARIQQWVATFLRSSQAPYIALGTSICVAHQKDCGEILSQLLSNAELAENAVYFWRVLKCAGDLGRRDTLELLKTYRHSEQPATAFWSAWSSIILGDKESIVYLKPFVMVENTFRDQAMGLLLRSLPIANAKAVVKELKSTEDLRAVIKSAGILGEVCAASWLMPLMSDPVHSRIAADSLALMTGMDLLTLSASRNELGPDHELSDDNDFVDDPDDALLWPDPFKVSQWMNSNLHRFQPGQRYLQGEIIDASHCQQIERWGFQREKKAAALELLAQRIKA